MVTRRSQVQGYPGPYTQDVCQDDLAIAVLWVGGAALKAGIVEHFSVWSPEHLVRSPPELL